MVNFKALGQRIKEGRRHRNLTQEKFSEILNITPEHLSRVESGYRPSLVLIEKISSIFGVDESELLFGTPSDEKETQELINKISSMDHEKRHALEQIIDAIAEI